jgi:hypothetical protein
MDPVSPNTPFNVTLEAQQWNGVVAALIKAPYELAAPLIQAITNQLQQQQPQPNGVGDGLPTMVPPVPPPTH